MAYKSRQKLTRDKFLNRYEIKKFLGAIDQRTKLGMRDFAILKVFLHTGLRKAELLNLKISDLQQEDDRFYFRVKSKGGNIDEQPLEDDDTIKAIDKYLDQWGHGEDPHDPLFISNRKLRHGKVSRLSRNACDFLVKKYAKKAKLKKNVHPHTLRHTFGSAFAAQNKDIVLTREALRHRSITSTSIYTHAEEDRIRDGLKRLKFE